MIAWALETLIATSLLMLLVLFIRTPVRRAFGPQIAYALWLLPLTRLVLPPMPQSWREHGVAPLADASQQVIYLMVEPIAAAPAIESTAAGSPLPWGAMMLVAWLLGAGGFVAYHWLSHWRFCTAIRRQARSTGQVASGKVEVIESDAADGPLAFGIFRKTVAFPRDFTERYDETERDLALAHELGHHARGDLIANWAALVMLGLHWFNPIAWKAFRAFRADQEMACDALVLAGREPSLRHAYGRAIVKSAHGGAVSAACHLHTINDLKGRLKMLLDNEKRSRARVRGGIAASAAIGVAALGLTASGTQAAETIRTKVEDRIGVKLDTVELPSFALAAQDALPPAPPAPPAPEDDAVPPAPPAPPAAPEIDGETRTFVFRRADASQGKAVVAGDFDPIDVVERNCGGGDDWQQIIINEENGDKPRLVVCTDRIERMAEHAAVQAEQAVAHAEKTKVLALHSARMGMQSAMMSLRHARRAIEAQRELTDAQRREALEGIDQAMAELEAERIDID